MLPFNLPYSQKLVDPLFPDPSHRAVVIAATLAPRIVDRILPQPRPAHGFYEPEQFEANRRINYFRKVLYHLTVATLYARHLSRLSGEPVTPTIDLYPDPDMQHMNTNARKHAAALLRHQQEHFS